MFAFVLLAVLAWAGIWLLEEPILRFFGADAALLPLAQRYLLPVKWVLPLFLFNQMLAAFLRNDGAPALAPAGVLAGGIFNVFGDYFCVFTLDMGMFGAGLATAVGAGISFVVMFSHFFSRRNTLRLRRSAHLMRRLRELGVTGFSTFFIDVAMGILTILFNRKIMRYLGADALAIYGPVINISTFVQCCAYSVGHAAQPIISTNFGAHPRRAPAGAGVVRGVLYFLDGTEPRLAEPLYPHLHAADGGDPFHGAGHRPDVCRVVPAAAAEHLLHVLFSGDPQAGRCVFCLRHAGARHQRRADFAAAGRAWANLDLAGDAGHGAAGRVLCRDGHAARDAGAAAVLKPGLSAYTPVIGGDVHEVLESLFVRGGVPAADGGEDGRPGGGNGRA